MSDMIGVVYDLHVCKQHLKCFVFLLFGNKAENCLDLLIATNLAGLKDKRKFPLSLSLSLSLTHTHTHTHTHTRMHACLHTHTQKHMLTAHHGIKL